MPGGDGVAVTDERRGAEQHARALLDQPQHPGELRYAHSLAPHHLSGEPQPTAWGIERECGSKP